MADDEGVEQQNPAQEIPSELGTPAPAAETDEAAASNRPSTTDPLNTEFLYYSSVLRMFGPTLTKEGDRRYIIPWIRKLFRPEYQSSRLREKRNRYLGYLTTSLLLDEAVDIFRVLPPDGPLPDLHEVHPEPVAAAQWETDNMWQDTLQNLSDDFQLLDCFVHDDPDLCRKEHQFDKILDQEFQLFLFLAKPYAAMISGGAERTRVAAWLQILCSIHGHECCSRMKAIRNDYMMALLGYLQDLRAVGPFAEYPSWQTLKPLAEAAKLAAENSPITDPTGCYANEFLAEQPMPDDGAFCYIAISGDMLHLTWMMDHYCISKLIVNKGTALRPLTNDPPCIQGVQKLPATILSGDSTSKINPIFLYKRMSGNASLPRYRVLKNVIGQKSTPPPVL